MFKTTSLTLWSITFIGLIILYYLHFSAQKIVYVDATRLLNNYQGMIDARQAYQQKAQSWQANVDTLASEVQRSIQAYEKESAALSTKEKALSQELIRTKQRQLADYQQAIREQAAQQDNEMTGSVLEQVNVYLRSYGEKNNYRIILAATEYGNLAYADEGIDITDEVLEGLNKTYRGQ